MTGRQTRPCCEKIVRQNFQNMVRSAMCTVFFARGKTVLGWAKLFFRNFARGQNNFFGNLRKNFLHFPFKNAINFCSKAWASRLASLGLRNYRFRPASAGKPAKKPISGSGLKTGIILAGQKKFYPGEHLEQFRPPRGQKSSGKKKQCAEALTFGLDLLGKALFFANRHTFGGPSRALSA